MVDEPVVDPAVPSEVAPKELEKRTEARVDLLADALLDDLLKRVSDGTATAAEKKLAYDYVKDCGVKLVIGEKTKAGELSRKLPFPEGVTITERTG
jgi:hypothetical protein